MQYQNVKKAVFLRRPNRFIAQVMLEGAEELLSAAEEFKRTLE